MAKAVYVVTEGDYSDYHIMACFSTREKAKQYVDVGVTVSPNRTMRIEKLELDVPPEEWFITIVRMQADGEVAEITTTLTDYEYPGFQYWYTEPNPVVRAALGNPPELVWCVQTDDAERAIKVTNEKRIAILAADRWGKAVQRDFH